MFKKFTRVQRLTIYLLVSLFTGCGGGGGQETSLIGDQVSPVSQIPATEAVASITALNTAPGEQQIVDVNQAVLRHVHRNTIHGELTPSGNYIASENAKVEVLTALGLYREITAQSDARYRIDLQENNLAYFRVTNTKPNGAVRVHNFFGVPAGYYMSFDSTNVEDDELDNLQPQCQLVSVRITGLNQQDPTSGLQINGQTLIDGIFEDNQGYAKDVTLCPVNQANDYLALVVSPTTDGGIRYGYHFYNDLQGQDVLEINIEHQAELMPWSSDLDMGNEYRLYANMPGASLQHSLYKNSPLNGLTGSLPKFNALALSDYVLQSTVLTDNGLSLYSRQFDVQQNSMSFDLGNIEFDEVSINPLDTSWTNTGTDQAQLVTGLMFDISLTQTYAFISMDPDVLSEQTFNFPLDDIIGLADTAFVALTGASAPEQQNMRYVGNAALFSGFVYWPNPQNSQSNNTDLFITANGSPLLQLMLDQKIEDFVQ